MRIQELEPGEIGEFGYPVRHKRKVPYHPRIRTSPDVIAALNRINHLDLELGRFILSAEDYLQLAAEAYASNIHTSTAMEGNPLSREQVDQITWDSIGRGPPSEVQEWPMQEILNHLASWTTNVFEGPWSSETLADLHQALMLGDPGSSPGQFRTERGGVETSGGQELLVAAHPKHIEMEIDSLFDWLNAYSGGLHPVVAGAVFFHEFESIHPFSDGNGRTGRTLFHIYLQTHGLPHAKLCLIEQELVKDVELYYEILARTDWSGDYANLVHHFVSSVLASYESAVQKFRDRDLLSKGLDETATRLLVQGKSRGDWFSIRDARGWCPGTSDHVLRNRLETLVETGALVEAGQTSAKRYLFLDPLQKSLNEFAQALQNWAIEPPGMGGEEDAD